MLNTCDLSCSQTVLQLEERSNIYSQSIHGEAGNIGTQTAVNVMFDVLFMVSSINEPGRRQLTDTIRREIASGMQNIPIACTRTCSFCTIHNVTKEIKKPEAIQNSNNKSLQMFILCQSQHAVQVRELLYKIIHSRKPRKYCKRSSDGHTYPTVPIFVREFKAEAPINVCSSELLTSGT
uniref:Uncharacterized protein n=1 Tax=Cercopithecine alphaherpesvirus 9 TaxID=35246 RepID=Q9WR43_9ALPH|nr:unknown [Cercopithecine alphaherpesvirus 9]